MAEEMEATEVPGYYWIIGGADRMELWASAQLGDTQHRRNYKVTLRKFMRNVPQSIGGESFSVQLQIDSVSRRKGSDTQLFVGGCALLTKGLVRVSGTISFFGDYIRGDLNTVPKQECMVCIYRDYSELDRCPKCGEALRTVEIPTLL